MAKRGFEIISEVGVEKPSKMPEGIEAGFGIGAAIMGGGAVAVALIVVVMIVKWVLSFGG